MSSNARYDAFLSYNSQDRPAVEELAGRLGAEGLALYLEVWELLPGREFQPGLAEALIDSKTCIAFLGPSGLGPWQKEEIQVAIDRRVRDPDFHVIPVLLPGAERPRRGAVAHLEFLINASWVEFPKSLDDRRAFDSLVAGIRGIKPTLSPEEVNRWEDRRPYRGLEAFGPDDAPFFFGRENLTDWLVSDLRREIRAPVGVRFLAVLGPSGSGKSSVVLAGLVPRLKDGAIDGSERWPIAVVRPGDDPLKELGTAVAAQFVPAGSLPDARRALQFSDDMRSDERMLDAFARMALNAASAEARLLVVVDQFEEVFTYRPEDEKKKETFAKDRDAFFANLLLAAAARGGRVAVVLTMRSDFLGPCAPFERLNNVLNAHLIQVGPMREDELRAAIERPAFKVGCEPEPGLTERLLADVEGQAGALPLLQFTLDELWQRQDVRRLTLRAYTELGGVEGTLEHRANETLQKLSQADQDLCRRIFLHLVQPGEGTEDTKRRVSYRELLPDDPARAEAVKRVVGILADRDARLITTRGTGTAEGVVEVAHEALIRGWKKLRQWIDADRAGLRVHRQLTEAAREWEDHESDASFLFRGIRLAVAREWAESHREDLNPTESAFLAASQEAERKREEQDLEKERRLRRAEEERAREAEQREREATEFAERERRLAEEARSEATQARSLLLATQARDLLRRDHQLALLLAAEAVYVQRRGGEPKLRAMISEDTLNEAISNIANCPLVEHPDEVGFVAFAPDGKTLASASCDGTVRLWDASASGPDASPRVLRGHEGGVTHLAFAPDGKTLASASCDGSVRLWDASASGPDASPRVFRGHEGEVTHVTFAPDGKTLASASCDGTVRLWGLRVPGARVLRGHEGEVSHMAFAPDGKTLASASCDGTVRLWGLNVPDSRVLRGHEGEVSHVLFAPDGKTLASASCDGTVRLWGLSVPGARVLRGHEMEVTRLAYAPDGKTLASASCDGTVRLWGLSVPDSRVLRGHEGEITHVAFAPDGKTLASASCDGTVRLWGLSVPDSRVLRGHEGEVTHVAFTPDGRTLASASRDGTVRLWTVDLTDLMALAKRIANRNLSLVEWQDYFYGEPYRRTFDHLPLGQGATEDRDGWTVAE